MHVEWDEAKRLANLSERNVDFRDAALIFEGPVIEARDTREEYGERRFRALGRVNDVLYHCLYMARSEPQNYQCLESR
jgi:uncharacterized DUF497 family protein